MANFTQDLHKTPLMRVCIPFISGIILVHQINFSVFVLWGLFFTFFIALCIVYGALRQYSYRYLFSIVLSCLLISAGGLLWKLQNVNTDPEELNQNGHYLGYVSSLPQQKKKSVFVEFTINGSDSMVLSKPIKTWIYFENSIPNSLLQPGKWLMIKAYLKVPEKNSLPTEFDFYTYLADQKVYYTAYVPLKAVYALKNKPKNNLKIMGLKIKKRVLEIFVSNNIEGEELALISALTIGYKKLIPAEQREAYAASGAMHVLAVSGLHVGILYVLFSFLFGFLKQLPFGNIWFTLVIIVLMLGFAFITGFSPSVTRATIMFSFIAFGKLIRKQQYIVNTIAASACVILLIQPNALFQIGFQLSYLAVIGIVLFYPVFSEKWNASGRFMKWLVGLILVSVIAQAITAPMNAFYFHRFANYSILANLIVIPLVTILLNGTVLLIALGFIGINFPILGGLVQVIAKTMNTCVYAISNIPGSTFESLYLTPTESIGLYAVLISILIFTYYKSKWTIWLVLSVMLLFTGHKTIAKYINFRHRELLVYKDFGVPRMLVKGRNEGLVVYSVSRESLLFCPVWFFKNGVSEKNVNAVDYKENLQTDDFILYRQFVGFKNSVFKIVNVSNSESNFISSTTTINLNAKSEWHIQFKDVGKSKINSDKTKVSYLNLNKIGVYNTLVE